MSKRFSQIRQAAISQLAMTNETGSGLTVFNNAPTLIGPALGTPTSGDLTNEINLPVSTGISGLGTGVAAALAAAASGSGGICLTSMSLCGSSNPNIISNTGTATAPIFAVEFAYQHGSDDAHHRCYDTHFGNWANFRLYSVLPAHRGGDGSYCRTCGCANRIRKLVRSCSLREHSDAVRMREQ